jgi:hypothetical protein
MRGDRPLTIPWTVVYSAAFSGVTKLTNLKMPRRMSMKKVIMASLCAFAFAFAFAAYAVQATGEKAAAKLKTEKATAVDCSKVEDAAITANVKDKLAMTPSLKDTPVQVETKGGVVMLAGSVKNGGIKGVATRMAKLVPCVKSVDNKLAIEKAAAATKK